MTTLRSLTISLFAILAIYTIFVIWQEGANFVPGFVGDILAVTWRGQINIDFFCYLAVTAWWVAWRHKFSAGGILLGLVVLVGAFLFFAPYLLYAIARSNGDMATLMLGENRTTG